MEAPSSEDLEGWAVNWRDLVDMEIVPILTSADFWPSRTPATTEIAKHERT